MWTIDRRLLFVAIAVGSFGLATLSLVYANHWWLSVLLTLSIGCWLTGVLWTIYAPPAKRAAGLGALITSFLYLLFAGGPWFQSHVGPWLLTTRALVAIDTNLLGHEQSGAQPVPAGAAWVTSVNGLYTNYTIPGSTGLLWAGPQPQTASPPVSPTVAVGQWLFAWCAAAIGGFGAAWIARRARHDRPAASVPHPPAAASVQSGSPFAETVRAERGR
jgi:hypothetical protein